MQTRQHTALPVFLAVVMHATAAHAQVGLQVRSGNLWGAGVEMGALGPVTLRWKWDGVGTPTRVEWQLASTTSPSTTTSRDSDPIAQEGPLRVPASGGVYQLFTVTPQTGTRLPFYIRVRVENAGKAVYSRWITVRAATRAAPVAGSSGSTEPLPTAGTQPTNPLQTAGTQPTIPLTSGTVLDDQPLQVLLAGITALRTARVGYREAPLTTNSTSGVNIDYVYAIAVSIAFNWSDLPNSAVLVKASPVAGLAANMKFAMKIPVWSPSGGPAPIKGHGENAVIMVAVMHRYGSPTISVLEGAILSAVKNRLKAAESNYGPASGFMLRTELLKEFISALRKATEGSGASRDLPVDMGELGWAHLLGGPSSTIGQELEAARKGTAPPYAVLFGSDTNRGGQFRLELSFLVP